MVKYLMKGCIAPALVTPEAVDSILKLRIGHDALSPKSVDPWC